MFIVYKYFHAFFQKEGRKMKRPEEIKFPQALFVNEMCS